MLASSSDVDESMIPGYYQKKYKTQVKTVSDFVA